MRKGCYILILFFLLIPYHLVHAQVDKFRVSELSPYIDSYVNPFAKAMSTGMSGAWVTTAATHKLWGFDFSVNSTIVSVPQSDYYFSPIGLLGNKYFVLGTKAPTVSAGNSLFTPIITRNILADGGVGLPLTIPALKGFGLNKGASLSMQGSIGLPVGTELTVRLMPETKVLLNNLISSDYGLSISSTMMWGVGVKHDIKQWIPGIKKLPFLEISSMLTFSKFRSGLSGNGFSLSPEFFSEQGVPVADNELPGTWDNQRFKLNMTSFSGSLLIGATLPVFQPYIGVGFSSSGFNAGLKGNYPVIEYGLDNLINPVLQTAGVDVDPVYINAKETSANFIVGARIKLSVFMLYYSYTHQYYSMHSLGLGLTVGRDNKS